jgi:hypothetical protein
MSTTGAVMIWLVLHAAACVTLDQSRTPEEKGIQQIDSLHTMAGVYVALLPGTPKTPGELLLALFPDGSCLFADKRYGRMDAAVMTGSWDMNHSDAKVTLRLKNHRGAKRILVLLLEGADLKVTGGDFGGNAPMLVRRDAQAR